MYKRGDGRRRGVNRSGEAAKQKANERKAAEEQLAKTGEVTTEMVAAAQQGRVWTQAETQVHLQAIENYMLGTFSEGAIARTMQERYGVKKKRTHELMARVREKWLEEDRENLPSNKAAAVRRIMTALVMARGEKKRDAQGRPTDEWLTRPNHSAIATYERLLADIQGTKAPIEVNVDTRMSHTVHAIVAEMTPEQVAEELREIRERERKAAEYDRQMAALPRLTVVEGTGS